MTIVRIIKERLRLDACTAEMDIDVPYSANTSWKSVGSVRLLKIKPLAKAAMVQVKVRSRYGKDARVQKFDIPGATMVEHEREATEADGPDAGTPMRAIAHHDGIRYQVVRPGDDAEKLVAAAAERQRPRRMEPTIEDMLGGGPGGAMMAQVLASAATMAGFDLRPEIMRSHAYATPESYAAVTELLAGVDARRVGPGTRSGRGSANGEPNPSADEVRDAAERMIEDRLAGIWPGN